MAARREVRGRGGEAARNGMWCGPSLHRALAEPAGLLHISVSEGQRSSKGATAPAEHSLLVQPLGDRLSTL